MAYLREAGPRLCTDRDARATYSVHRRNGEFFGFYCQKRAEEMLSVLNEQERAVDERMAKAKGGMA